MKKYCILFLSLCVASLWACTAENTPQKHRVLISTDIGGTDPDDNQSMAHLLMYSDCFDIEGLVSSPSFGEGSKEEILRMIDLYEDDYDRLKSHAAGCLSPDSLRSLCKQGRKGLQPYCGYETPTEGSEWIVSCARKNDTRPLWILVWGTLDDVAQALHDAPDILPRIRVYWIGGPNKKWGVNSYAYIAENFPDLWIIENNASYRGFIGNNKKDDIYNKRYYETFIKGAGKLGADFIDYYDGQVKMGDTPSLLYVMNGNPEMPEGESWGGSFEKTSYSTRTIYTRHTTLQDTVPVYSVVEFRFDGPQIDKPAGTRCFDFIIDRQTWAGVYLGNGIYAVRYAPKAPATLDYRIVSDIEQLNGATGVFVVDRLWPGKKSADSYEVGAHWYTDRQDRDLFDGAWQGFKTVSKWRNDVLDDWAERWSWLK